MQQRSNEPNFRSSYHFSKYAFKKANSSPVTPSDSNKLSFPKEAAVGIFSLDQFGQDTFRHPTPTVPYTYHSFRTQKHTFFSLGRPSKRGIVGKGRSEMDL